MSDGEDAHVSRDSAKAQGQEQNLVESSTTKKSEEQNQMQQSHATGHDNCTSSVAEQDADVDSADDESDFGQKTLGSISVLSGIAANDSFVISGAQEYEYSESDENDESQLLPSKNLLQQPASTTAPRAPNDNCAENPRQNRNQSALLGTVLLDIILFHFFIVVY